MQLEKDWDAGMEKRGDGGLKFGLTQPAVP